MVFANYPIPIWRGRRTATVEICKSNTIHFNIYKMKNFSKGALSLIIMCFFFSLISCEKEDASQNKPTLTNNKSEISAINGRLVFVDQSAFTNCLNWIYNHQNSPEEIIQNFGVYDYHSMMEIYNTGMNKDKNSEEFSQYCKAHSGTFAKLNFEESEIYELQAPSILAYIANENGIFQIGKQIIRVTSQYTYTILNGDESKIAMLMQPVESISDLSIEVKPTQITKGEYSYRTAYFDSKHRLVARLTSQLIGNFYYYNARSTAQKKNALGIWVQEDISAVYLSWLKGYAWDGSTNYTIATASYAVYNNSDLERTVIWITNPVIFGSSSCIATHTGTRSGTTVVVGNNDIFPN